MLIIKMLRYGRISIRVWRKSISVEAVFLFFPYNFCGNFRKISLIWNFSHAKIYQLVHLIKNWFACEISTYCKLVNKHFPFSERSIVNFQNFKRIKFWKLYCEAYHSKFYFLAPRNRRTFRKKYPEFIRKTLRQNRKT
jgi:hypothetical protein